MGFVFRWDDRKAASNSTKHGVSFAEASTAFGDPLSRTLPDPDHSLSEERLLLVGESASRRLLVVVHVENGNEIRIISARCATRRERRTHEET